MDGAELETSQPIDGNGSSACFVYVLGSTDNGDYRTYVGWTLDLDRRLAEHNAGSGAKSTRGRAWTVIHVETFASRNEAMSREWHLKRDRAFRVRLANSAQIRADGCPKGPSP